MAHIDEQRRVRRPISSTRVIVLGFLGAILFGAALLMLPAATAPGESTDFLTALFTSTTSICVTGLVVVDTYAHWSMFGKTIILGLIQLGGFGVITMFCIFMLTFRRKFSLQTRILLQDYYNLDNFYGLIKFLKKVILGTLLIEGIGALMYSFVFIPEHGFLTGIWYSVFHSVSAFCNAGLDIVGPISFIPYQTNVIINVTTIFLIIMGGLGYIVWFDLLNRFKERRKKNLRGATMYSRLSEMSKLVLALTAFLIISGAILVFIFEHDNPDTLGEMSLGNQIMASIFQSVTFRTAGFATISQGNLRDATAIIGLLYMFIGGSPVGTAGGVKTVTLFIIVANAIAFTRNRRETIVFDRKISEAVIAKATAVVTIALSITILSLIGLMVTNDHLDALSVMYEVFSATATVGLSQGITASLNSVGRLILIFAMYAGRIGPISMALFFTPRNTSQNKISHAEGHFTVG